MDIHSCSACASEAEEDLDLEKDRLPTERALGVQWCVETDILRFKVVLQERPLTRRGILSMASSIYDPIGILSRHSFCKANTARAV